MRAQVTCDDLLETLLVNICQLSTSIIPTVHIFHLGHEMFQELRIFQPTFRYVEFVDFVHGVVVLLVLVFRPLSKCPMTVDSDMFFSCRHLIGWGLMRKGSEWGRRWRTFVSNSISLPRIFNLNFLFSCHKIKLSLEGFLIEIDTYHWIVGNWSTLPNFPLFSWFYYRFSRPTRA